MSFNVESRNQNYSRSKVFLLKNTGPWHQWFMVEQTLMYSTTWCFCYKTLLSNINKADRHNMTEIWLKVALSTINH
jgi:hypothetical protein